MSGFNDAIQKRKEIKKFYHEELIPKIKEEQRAVKSFKTRSSSHTAQASLLTGGLNPIGTSKYQSSLETATKVPPIQVPTERSQSVMNGGSTYTSGFSNSLMKKVMAKPQQQEAFFAYIATRPEVNQVNIQSLQKERQGLMTAGISTGHQKIQSAASST